MQRLGKNQGGYHGERIDINAVLRDVELAAERHGWITEVFHQSGGFRLLALQRHPHSSPHRAAAPDSTGVPHPQRPACVYVSTGIHGDEPAGPLAACRLLEEDAWPDEFELRLCPCLNPAGFALNRRENADGLDLNRQYLNPTAGETVAHVNWLKRQPAFDLSLCLHEDWESHGFYVYELNADQRPSLAESMVTSVARVCPIDRSEAIEGRPAREGIIRPSVDPRSRPDWPEAFYLLTHKTRLSYTLEAPSDFALPVRIAALVAGVKAALAGLAGRPR
jgi:protein MpaA